jgi:hypothetical protein
MDNHFFYILLDHILKIKLEQDQRTYINFIFFLTYNKKAHENSQKVHSCISTSQFAELRIYSTADFYKCLIGNGVLMTVFAPFVSTIYQITFRT